MQIGRKILQTQRNPSANKFSVFRSTTNSNSKNQRTTLSSLMIGHSFDNAYWVQQNLKKFINEQYAGRRLVAIIRTGSGIVPLQSFTTTNATTGAINKLRWNRDKARAAH
jgi:hypothetical protein